jgi:hypothetical protein
MTKRDAGEIEWWEWALFPFQLLLASPFIMAALVLGLFDKLLQRMERREREP